jgi:hypothetical protein
MQASWIVGPIGGRSSDRTDRRIAPTRLEGINLRGVFRPIERYAEQILPSQSAAKTPAVVKSTTH